MDPILFDTPLKSRLKRLQQKIIRLSGLTFDGTGKALKNSQTAYNLVNYSLEFWVKGDGQTDKYVYAEGASGSNNPIFGFSANSIPNKLMKVLVRDDSNASALSANSTTIIFNNVWRHIVWTDANGVAKLYVDGVLDATNFTYTRGTLTLDRTAIGGLQRSGFGNTFIGSIDNVIVYPSVLTQLQVTQRYNFISLGIAKTLDWELDEGSGTTAIDSSGNSSNGVISGGAIYNAA